MKGKMYKIYMFEYKSKPELNTIIFTRQDYVKLKYLIFQYKVPTKSMEYFGNHIYISGVMWKF